MSTNDEKDIKPIDAQHDDDHEERDDSALSRRDFFKKGAIAGAGAAALAASSQATAQESVDDIVWDYEADVVIVGSGAVGLPAAIRARDAGSTVLIVEQNFDVGGVMLHSGGFTSLGGGDALQQRDIAEETTDMVTVGRQVPEGALQDDPELLFRDMTDWSVVDRTATAAYRFNDRAQHRAWADNAAPTRQFLMDNYVRWTRITGTHRGGGVSRARAASPIMRLGDETNIPEGTITQEDAGIPGESSSHFAPRIMDQEDTAAGPNTVGQGSVLSRSLEYSAREKGARFMLNRHMDELIREEPFSGRVLGIRASYTPRFDPDTGERLESYMQEGNIDERQENVTIRARKAVIVASGGHSGNPEFRSMFYPAMKEPAHPTSGMALLGFGRARDGSGIIAGMRVGANLAGMQQNYHHASTYHIQDLLATPDAYTDMYPGHPTFPFRRSTGIPIGSAGFEQLIAVNHVGKRFYREDHMPGRPESLTWPAGPEAGVPNSWDQHDIGDWRNNRPEWVQEMYNRSSAIDAALQINEGSEAPDFLPGPLWGIFDQATLDRTGWNIEFPHTGDNAYFFQADTLEELQEMVQANPHQRVAMTNLPETVERWNGFVDAGEDEDFEREAGLHRIDTPPFYAASIQIVWHDSYGGLRINGDGQVLDMEGRVIPGLYSGGEASGGGRQHGLGRALVHGYIAGRNAANEPVANARRNVRHVI